MLFYLEVVSLLVLWNVSYGNQIDICKGYHSCINNLRACCKLIVHIFWRMHKVLILGDNL